MKRIICLLLLQLSLVGIICAQTSFSSNNYVPIPPSPDVRVMNRFGDIPINRYTGVPDISIPLFTIRSGSLSIPITLRYHASGIKVNDIASSVGLGWTLDAGGYVSRTVQDKPDDAHASGILFYQNNGAKFWTNDQLFKASQVVANNYLSKLVQVSGNESASSKTDKESDFYQYHIPGEFGRFAFTINQFGA